MRGQSGKLDWGQLNSDEVVICHDCDLILKRPKLEPMQRARCPRCGYAIAERGFDTLNAMIAASSTATLLLLVSLATSFIGFSARGQERNASLIGSIDALWVAGHPIIAFLAFVFVVLMPVFYLLSVLNITLNFKFGTRALFTVNLLNAIFFMRPWAMAEVFLIGALVSLIKISSLADVSLGIGFWSFMLFCIAFPALIAMTDRHQLWEWHFHGYHQE